jgi:diacylglycerol O-acyltransferase
MEEITNHKRPVAGVDTLWLQMDTPENLMVIEGIMMFDGPIDVPRATNLIKLRLADRYPVFRQIATDSRNPLGGPSWVDDPDFDINNHISFAELDPPGDDKSLQDYVGALMSKPMNRTIPLWEIHIVNGYNDGTAMVARFHHALADGTALARVLLEMTDDDPDDDLRELERLANTGDENVGPTYSALGISRRFEHVIGAHEGGVRQSVLDHADSVGDAASETISGITKKGSGITKKSLSAARSVADPQRVRDAMSLADAAPDIVNKLVLAGAPESPLTGSAGIQKTAVWSRPHDLQPIKEAGRNHGATINDMMIAALAGALRTHVIEHGGDPHDLSTMIPVNLRPMDRPLPRELGNKFALVMLSLPISKESPIDRLLETQARMDAIKDSPEAVLTFGIIGALGKTNPKAGRYMVDFFSAKGTGVTTNVPGPRDQRYFAGTAVDGILGWVPGAGMQTFGTCIFSYNGKIQVGFKVDTEAVPDPNGLVAAYDAELLALTHI